MDRETLKKSILSAYDAFPSAMAIIMGVLLCIYGIYRAYVWYAGDMISVLPLISASVMLVSGVFIVLLGRHDLVRTIGLYALSLGLTRFILRYELLDFSNVLLCIPPLFMMLLALNLMYTGVSFTRGYVIRRRNMMVTAAFFAIVDLILVISIGTELLDFLIGPLRIDLNVRLIECLMSVVLLLLLDCRQIRYGTNLGRHAHDLDRIRNCYRLPQGPFIETEVADALLSRSGPQWKEIGDGTVISEMTFPLHSITSDVYITAQIWEGSDALFLTVSSTPGTILFTNRMRADEIVRTDDGIHIYGSDGTDFTVGVKEVMI